MKMVLAFALGGATSWLLRAGLITLVPHHLVPPAVTRSLRHAAPAAFAALVAVSVSDHVRGDGQLAGWPMLAATGVTLVVALLSRRVLLTLLAGAAAATAFTAW